MYGGSLELYPEVLDGYVGLSGQQLGALRTCMDPSRCWLEFKVEFAPENVASSSTQVCLQNCVPC